MNQRSKLFLLWIIQGLAAFAWLASLPASAERGILFGFSASRLALMAAMLALTAFSALLYWRANLSLLGGRLRKLLYQAALLGTLAAPLTIMVLRALGKTTSYTYTAYGERLAPLAAWVGLSALELAVTLARNTLKNEPIKTVDRLFLRATALALLALALTTGFIALSGIGITRYNDGSWGAPTTPLLEWQILLALGTCLAFAALETRWKWLQKDRFIFLAIYAFTCLLWLSQPINPGYFATAPRAPNFEIYPFSDALIYAQYAQSALVGNGFMWPDVPTRPLYIAFITWLHAAAGQDYTRVILLQTLVLAAFPAVLYLLGKELGSRPLGAGLALLAGLRDLTANTAAPFALNYTYTKLFFSEIPAALLICLFTWMSVRWMRKPKAAWYPLLAGGLLGISALIRLQSAVILAAVIPIGFLVVKDRKRWLSGSALMVLGVALAMIPWLARNYQATGGIVLDNPISQSMVLARRWSGNSGNDLYPHLPGEGDAEYSSRMAAMALASLRADPGRIIGSAFNHFFNNEIGNLLVFPLRDKLDSPGELVWPTRAFWQTWNGQPSAGQMALIGFYLLLLAAGLASAVQANGPAGLLPLGLSMVYNAWTALFLSSGDRFLVPVDWAVSLYMLLGLLKLSSLTLTGTSARPHITTPADEPKPHTPAQPWGWTLLTGAFILLCGASISLTENAFPRLYPAASQADLQAKEVTVRGRAIYPRWYEAGDGEPGTAKLGYGAESQARLVFFMTGEINRLVILPIEQAPEFFPNAADVVVTGSLQDSHLRARSIVVTKDGKSANYQP